jgi:putative addiction module component (TIGR02574 family)
MSRSEVMAMAKTVPMPPPGFHDLSPDEKLDYVQSLWDQLSAKPNEIPVPDWHRQILDERLAADEAHLQEGRTWEEVRDGLLRRLHDRKTAP